MAGTGSIYNNRELCSGAGSRVRWVESARPNDELRISSRRQTHAQKDVSNNSRRAEDRHRTTTLAERYDRSHKSYTYNMKIKYIHIYEFANIRSF